MVALESATGNPNEEARRVTAVTEQPAWERRFTATEIGFPSWDDGAPDHLALVSTRSGSRQIWAHDLRVLTAIPGRDATRCPS